MSEELVKITGITGLFVYFAYGLAYFAFLSALILATHSIVSSNPFISDTTNIAIDLFNRIGGARSVAVTASALCFISLLTGILLNDLAKKFSIISTLLVLVTSFMGVIVINIMLLLN